MAGHGSAPPPDRAWHPSRRVDRPMGATTREWSEYGADLAAGQDVSFTSGSARHVGYASGSSDRGYEVSGGYAGQGRYDPDTGAVVNRSMNVRTGFRAAAAAYGLMQRAQEGRDLHTGLPHVGYESPDRANHPGRQVTRPN